MKVLHLTDEEYQELQDKLLDGHMALVSLAWESRLGDSYAEAVSSKWDEEFLELHKRLEGALDEQEAQEKPTIYVGNSVPPLAPEGDIWK